MSMLIERLEQEKGDDAMANAKKWRRKKMAKHKHRKRLKKTRWQRRQSRG
jgi:hypothetical protein